MTNDNDIIPLYPDDEPDAEEEQLLRLARGLGDRTIIDVDPDRIVAQVMPRVAAARRADLTRRRGIWLSSGLVAAAALVLAVVPNRGTAPVVAPSVVAPSVASKAIRIDELDGLGQEDLQSLLKALDNGLPDTESGHGMHGLQDLNARELQTVLDGLQG